MISTIDESQRSAAKVAAVSYLIAVAIVVFATYGIYAHLIVRGNTAETARNIVEHERLFRINIICDLIYAAGIVVLLTALFTVLKPVNRTIAMLAAFCRLVYAFMFTVTALVLFLALRLVKGADYLRVFEPDRLQAVARLLLGAGFDAYYVGMLFYALASTACGYLWFKSGYIPRPLAAWGVISSAWCAACTVALMIFPHMPALVLWLLDSPMASFEITTSFWLLFKGLTPSEIPEAGHPSAGAQARAV